MKQPKVAAWIKVLDPLLERGSVHDKKICDLEQIEFLKKTVVITDLGFLGLSSETAQIIMPHKRKKNQELNQEQNQ